MMNDFPSILKGVSSSLGVQGSTPKQGDLIAPIAFIQTFENGLGLREALDEILEDHSARISGWLLWTEELQIIDRERPDGFGRGWPLAGELHIPGQKEHSLQISQNGRDWQIRSISRNTAPSSPDGLPASFLETRELLAWPQLKKLTNRKLRYEIAWRLNKSLPTPCFRPAEFRFIGFSDNSSAS